MRNDFIKNGKNWDQNQKNSKYPWTHKNTIPDTPELRRLVLGLVMKVAIQVLFTQFCYSFGGKLYWQKKGGPIGARITMAVAQLVMEFVWDRFIEIWKETNCRKIDRKFKDFQRNEAQQSPGS